MARHWLKTGKYVWEQEAGESYRAHGESRNPVLVAEQRNHARADRAWAGLRVRLKFGQTPRRDGRRTGDEKRRELDWLPQAADHLKFQMRINADTNAQEPETPKILRGVLSTDGKLLQLEQVCGPACRSGLRLACSAKSSPQPRRFHPIPSPHPSPL